MSKLTQDLNTVAGIVGELGRNIADAQKRFDLDYLESLEKLLAIAKRLAALTGKEEDGKTVADNQAKLPATFQQVLLAIAPSRYQFTETTLSVRLNLAQSLNVGASVGVSAGFGAVAVNAALTVGYRFDYQAAAECKSVIHAMPPDAKTLGDLLGRARELNDKALEVPGRSEVDEKIHERLEAIYGKLPDLKLVADAADKKIKPAGE